MKTAISVPDGIYRAADKAAKRLGISRSELYTRALREFLSGIEATEIKESYDEAFGSDSDREGDEARSRAARKTLLAVEW